MPFTPEELDAAETEIKAHYESKGILFKTQAELDADKSATETAAINAATKSTHEKWEAKLGEVIGEKKPDGLKGFDWLEKDLATKLKPKEVIVEKIKEVDPSKSQETDLLKAQAKALEEKIEKMSEQISQKDKDLVQKTIKASVRGTLSGLKFSGEDAEKAAKKDLLETAISSNYDLKLDDNDRTIIYDKDGELILDPTTNAPMSLETLAKSKFAFMLAPEIAPGVTGTGTKQVEVNKLIDGKKVILAATYEALREEMRAQGYVAGSAASNEILERSLAYNRIEKP